MTDETPPGVVQTPQPVPEQIDDPHLLCRLFLQRHPGKYRHYKGQWWEYRGTHYEEVNEREIRFALIPIVKEFFNQEALLANGRHTRGNNGRAEKVTAALIGNTMAVLASLINVPESMEMPCWINGPGEKCLVFENGMVGLDTLIAGEHPTVVPHSALWFNRNVLPYAFDATATCNGWLAFLTEVLEGDPERINLVQEWFGYCLTPWTGMHKFLILEGEGSNGKSVVCELLTYFLGPGNISNVPLELVGQRFQLTTTLGKLANIAAEVGEIDKIAEGYLKSFTAGDRMIFERKFHDPIEAYPTARLVLATNNRPRFADRSAGLWRRMLLLPFRVQIPAEKQDKHLAEKLKLELPGILLWALEGLRRLRSNGSFTIPTLCKEAVDDYKRESNPARMFLEEFYELGDMPDGQDLACSDVYQAYSKWAKDHGYKTLGESTFGKEVFRAFTECCKARAGSGKRGRFTFYKNLRLREQFLPGRQVDEVSNVIPI